MKCVECGGEMRKRETMVADAVGGCCVVVRRVPCLICDECGEEFMPMASAEALKKIWAEVAPLKADTVIMNYREPGNESSNQAR